MSRFKRLRSGLPGNPSFLLSDLSDADVVSWNATTGKWDAAAPAGGSTVMTDFTGTAWRTFYTDGAGAVTELALGTSADVLTSNGASSAPSWQTPAGGALTYVQDDTDHGELLSSTFVAVESDSLGLVINGVDTDVQPRINFLDGDGGTQVGNIRATSAGFVVDNRRTSSPIILRSKNSSAAVVNNFHGDPDGQTTLYTDGLEVMHTDTQNIGIHTNGTLTDPWLGFYHGAGEGTRRGFLQMGTTATTMRWNSEVHGAIMRINGENAVGTIKNGFYFDPDGEVLLTYAGTNALGSATNGIKVFDTVAALPEVIFANNSGVEIGSVGYSNGNTSMVMDNRAANSAISAMRSLNTSGTLTNMIVLRPDTSVDLYYNGVLAFKTISGSIQTGTHTGIGAETITGYITINDLGGTSRKLAVVS